MSRPLYRNAAQEPPSRDARGHAGLWFDKFYNRWPIEESTVKLEATSPSRDKNPKLEWIQTLAGANTIGARDLIEETVFRLMRLIESRNGRATVFATESRFVTGLGRSHPVENGFAWHPTLGTPYLPASSVKGLVRSWAKAEGVAPTEQQRLFGGLNRRDYVFLDAVPVAPVHLEADIMTPHYAGWSDDDPPGDWCSPIPTTLSWLPLPRILSCSGSSPAAPLRQETSRPSRSGFDALWLMREAAQNGYRLRALPRRRQADTPVE